VEGPAVTSKETGGGETARLVGGTVVFAGLLAEAFTGVFFTFGGMVLKSKRIKGTAKAREVRNDDGRRKKEISKEEMLYT
jgi:hypothetical protein